MYELLISLCLAANPGVCEKAGHITLPHFQSCEERVKERKDDLLAFGRWVSGVKGQQYLVKFDCEFIGDKVNG